MKLYRKILICAIIVLSCIMAVMVLMGVYKYKPSNIWLVTGDAQEFDLKLPYSIKIDSEEIYVSAGDDSKKVPADQITIDLDESFSLSAEATGTHEAKVYLFNIIPVDTIDVNVVTPSSCYVGGQIVGISLTTDGVLVLGSGEVTTTSGTTVEPSKNILKSGDYVVEINGKEVNEKEKLVQYIQECSGDTITLTVNRNGEMIEVAVKPELAEDGTYKIGAWIRDDTAGIGTLTFIDPSTGKFGALGHGITDVDTGTLLEILSGDVYKAHVLSINKGKVGDPGEIVGSMSRNSASYIGSLENNDNIGVYGTVENIDSCLDKLEIDEDMLYEIGYASSVHEGTITIVSECLGELEEYTAEIEVVDHSNVNSEKAMKIVITDERLLKSTGGIVQGMSGSPIIQDGKLIGAVTHVLVDDPTKGYGIFIENMLEHN
ncbi:MAG: SpoIVB peptidase [Lachnospiraceae bacterium]|nr:SpoIVB peptidase [Lachnospiraceae bacterium]